MPWTPVSTGAGGLSLMQRIAGGSKACPKMRAKMGYRWLLACGSREAVGRRSCFHPDVIQALEKAPNSLPIREEEEYMRLGIAPR